MLGPPFILRRTQVLQFVVNTAGLLGIKEMFRCSYFIALTDLEKIQFKFGRM